MLEGRHLFGQRNVDRPKDEYKKSMINDDFVTEQAESNLNESLAFELNIFGLINQL